MNKELIRRNFSRFARYYDRYSTVQNLCASRLAERIAANNLDKILDVGCGTGNYTKFLRDKFPFAEIKALDISRKMIEIARNKLQDKKVEFIIADGEVVDFSEQFDLITSNACFQWFENLEGTIANYRVLLKRNGLILFSIFGPLTFYELNQSLRELFKKDELINSSNFLEKNKLNEILEKHFKRAIIEEDILTERFNSTSELLKKIRYTGVRGNGLSSRHLWTAKMLDKLQEIYEKRFGNLIVTYQVFYCRATR